MFLRMPLPEYSNWAAVPANLVTKTTLRKERLTVAPGQEPVATFYSRVYNNTYQLYDKTAAQPMRRLSSAVAVGLEKARQTRRLNETCISCGYRDEDVRAAFKKGLGRLCFNCRLYKRQAAAHNAAIDWAKARIAAADFVVIDTETTGLLPNAEVIEIAVVSPAGVILFNGAVRPSVPIEPGATATHGYVTEDLTYAPTYATVAPLVEAAVAGRQILCFNVEFDKRCITNSLTAAGMLPLEPAGGWGCIQYYYNRYVAEWSRRYGDWRWQRLWGGDHSAAGDSLAALQLLREMAAGEYWRVADLQAAEREEELY